MRTKCVKNEKIMIDTYSCFENKLLFINFCSFFVEFHQRILEEVKIIQYYVSVFLYVKRTVF